MTDQQTSTNELDSLVFEAQALIDRHRYEQARGVLKRALHNTPDNVTCLYLSAFVDYADGDADDARNGVAAVLRLAPEHYGARRLQAALLEDAGKLAEAELEWIALLREYPEDADSFFAYADLMLRALETDKAYRLATEGLRHEPDHEGCLYVLALLEVINSRSSGDGAQPEAALHRLLQEHPERLRTSLALVTTLSDRGDNRAALRVAQELLRSRPDSPQLLELVQSLRHSNHWSMKPLYPMQRWGWGGAIVIYVGAILILTLGKNLPAPLSATLTIVWVGYCLYSWVWPWALKRLLGHG